MLTLKQKNIYISKGFFAYTFCRIKVLSKKMSFDLVKKKRLFKSEEKKFWNDFLFLVSLLTCHIFNIQHFLCQFDVKNSKSLISNKFDNLKLI